jgi:hypothetical protein
MVDRSGSAADRFTSKTFRSWKGQQGRGTWNGRGQCREQKALEKNHCEQHTTKLINDKYSVNQVPLSHSAPQELAIYNIGRELCQARGTLICYIKASIESETAAHEYK